MSTGRGEGFFQGSLRDAALQLPALRLWNEGQEEAGLCPKGLQSLSSKRRWSLEVNKHVSLSGPGYDGPRRKSGTPLRLSTLPAASYESFWGYKKDRKQRASSWPLVKSCDLEEPLPKWQSSR